ncbi:MAG: peptide deformylase [Desulfobacteraceae bacterium]|nr:peptide deformylase [Desulfobacteraceae bacterium]
MTIRDIITYPDPFLREPTHKVEVIDDEIQRLIEDMSETMYAEPGVGLAANQVGSDHSVLLYDVSPREEGPNPTALINPEIVEKEGSQLSENEGCLSVPDFRADVKRYAQIRVRALDRNGEPLDFRTDGFESIVLQHEIDHLRGILFIDRISALKRQLYKRRRKKELRQV